MDDHSSTQSFTNLHHHHHCPSFHLTLPSIQSPEVGYQPDLDPLEQYGSRGEESAVSCPDLASSSGARRRGSENDRGFQSISASGLDEDGSLRGHLERDGGSGSHFVDSWYGGVKKEDDWEDGESCDSTADDFYRKGDCYSITNGSSYTLNCGSREGLRQKLGTNYNSYARANWDAKREIVYNREANVSYLTKQTTSHSRSAAGGFNDNSAAYRRTDSRGSDHYLGREEDYGSRCVSGEDQNQAADSEGPWHNVPPYTQTGEGRWRGEADTITLASTCPPQRSPITISSGTYTQKLDSFSEAFLSQRKKMFPMNHGEDSSGQIWEFGAGRGESPGLVKSRQSCGFDSDPYLLPYSSPNHPSLPLFPSPPTSSHIMSSVLSPPPTPLPPPPHSPSKMDSPGSFGGSAHSVFQGEESLGTLQFFNSRLQSLPSVLSSGMMWKFPLLSHCFSQSPCDPNINEGNLRSPHGADYVPRDILQTPETFLTSTSHRPSSHPPPRALCPLNTPSHHLPCPSSHLSGLNNGAAEKVEPYTVNQKVKKGQATLNQSLAQHQAPPLYTGTPFPSVLHSCGGQKRGHYTPRPLLNPVRRGAGLFSSLSSLHHGDNTIEGDCGVLQCVNVGHEFQAELPTCFVNGDRPQEESSREQLLWKPSLELEESVNMQDQVEKLLLLCSSSCLPGGGSNTELALHCLHHCQGNIMATVDMLLFWPPSTAGDYHYAGSNFWTDTEKSVFNAAQETCGKNFSLIQETVRTKTVSQCVEFYYLSKKLLDKQRKQREEEKREGELERQKSVTPICQPVDRQFGLAETVPVPSLASYFPCKLCGKMFYKIKSRNAHMKIHRQPPEDWADRRLQHQLLTQRLALSCPTNLLPPQTPALSFSSSSGLAGTPSSNNSNTDTVSISPSNASVPYNDHITVSNSHVIATINDSDPREQSSSLPFQHSWDSFGHGPSPAAFFTHTEGKEDVAGKVGGEEPISWQQSL
ncbi:hypothetical protein JOB18_001054 [Solea senegalensis]|nr:transcriptional-regulating factor 1-like [Solea senegalensis]XP_043876271.1 transcriptional-regulating factor 1-like [Solea senegalensis]KAG7495526.1 transcriptional-regulating factor 1-like [Solea senegalensis]KAG7495528.1 hypothetical protein JOB18_001054 [Solea senegalensis]